MESIMDYMMNDFRIIYLCSRNHNESGCGSFSFCARRMNSPQSNTEFHGVLLNSSHTMSFRTEQSEVKNLGNI